jgi:hypothetical protein
MPYVEHHSIGPVSDKYLKASTMSFGSLETLSRNRSIPPAWRRRT